MSISFKSAPAASLAPKAETGNFLTELRSLAALWRRRLSERAELAQCSERDLRDMGVSRATALGEIRKPFWRG